MSLAEILASQLLDPFRIGLIVALMLTMLRTEAVTGRVLPLALGVAFVALILPMSLGPRGGEALWRLVAVGVVANVAILAVVLAIRSLIVRRRG